MSESASCRLVDVLTCNQSVQEHSAPASSSTGLWPSFLTTRTGVLLSTYTEYGSECPKFDGAESVRSSETCVLRTTSTGSNLYRLLLQYEHRHTVHA